jgi:hypothetical protein
VSAWGDERSCRRDSCGCEGGLKGQSCEEVGKARGWVGPGGRWRHEDWGKGILRRGERGEGGESGRRCESGGGRRRWSVQTAMESSEARGRFFLATARKPDTFLVRRCIFTLRRSTLGG